MNSLPLSLSPRYAVNRFTDTLRARVCFALLCAGALVFGCGGNQVDSSAPCTGCNVLLVTLDTTRADRLGAYGWERARTPNLDALADRGALFRQAMATAPITLPSHSSIHTGLYPPSHGARDNGTFVLAEKHQTLAESLQSIGYDTVAAVGAFPLESQFGLQQGFDVYDDHFTIASETFTGQRIVPNRALFFDERRAGLVNEALMRDLAQDGQDRPFFAWAHYFDPHQPFEPPAPYDQLFAADPYDGEIAYVDEMVGSLLAHLDSIGVLDNTIVVVTADHGEGLGEHGEQTHSLLNYNSTLHVPLIIAVPGAEPQVVEPRVSSVDIVPTVLELVGAPAVAADGRSLVSMLVPGSAPAPPSSVPTYSETLAPRLGAGFGELRTYFEGSMKYIHGPRPELFDLSTDPRELRDLVANEPALAAELRGRLASLLSDIAPETSTQQNQGVDAATLARLRALGYLQSTSSLSLEVTESLSSDGEPPQDRVADLNEVTLAKLLLSEGRGFDALPLVRALRVRSMDNDYYMFLEAMALAQLGRLSEAKAVFESRSSQEGMGDSEELARWLATAFALRGEFGSAVSILESQQSHAPSARGQWYLASALSRAGQRSDARLAIERALVLDSGFAPARVDLAVHLARANQHDEALDHLRTALQQNPYYAKGHFNLGTFRYQQGDAAGARRAFQRALQIEPDYYRAMTALQTLAVERGDSDLAAQWAARAARLLNDRSSSDGVEQ